MKKPLAIAAVAAMMVAFTPTVKADNSALLPIITGIGGGIIGNQFGKGSGKNAATAFGAVAGILFGQRLNQTQNQCGTYNNPCRHVQSHYVPRMITRCDVYRNPGARAACNRGVADRNRAYQRQVESQAYRSGRGYGYGYGGYGRMIRPNGKIVW